MKNLSKFLSLILRHKPETIGIELDAQGWVDIQVLLYQLQRHSGFEKCMICDIENVVKEDEKSRYSIKDGKIRANQGHSLQVDLGLVAKIPPEILYHGTAERFVDIIFKEGLKPMERHHVHLSDNLQTAIQVGSRRGTAYIFKIHTKELLKNNIVFYQSENGVWLTDYVHPCYLS